MQLEYLPLLGVQRDLYRIPRGFTRFHEYICTMTDADSGDLKIPLVAMNPMGKDHVPALLDELLAVDADRAAAEAVAAVAPSLSEVSGEFKVSLVVADDRKGGWTNRYASEFSNCFEVRAMTRRGFIVGLLWTSEPASVEYTRDIVTRLLGAKDRATIFACLFGDRAASDLGYAPQGLSARAGFALALADRRAGTAARHVRAPA